MKDQFPFPHNLLIEIGRILARSLPAGIIKFVALVFVFSIVLLSFSGDATSKILSFALAIFFAPFGAYVYFLEKKGEYFQKQLEEFKIALRKNVQGDSEGCPDTRRR